MALLTVLLLVAVMAVLAAAVLDEVRFSIRRAANVQGAAQARWHALGAEELARSRIGRLNGGEATRVSPAWNGAPLVLPLDDGAEMTAVLRDGQACFNLNSVVEGAPPYLIARAGGTAQFAALARAVGASPSAARRAAAALTDWIDSDDRPLADGAEDTAYAALPAPRRTGGALMVEPGELRAVLGVDADLYARLAPLICVRPETGPSRLNPNFLTEDQWPLLAMLAEGVTMDQARAAIRARPSGGWDSVNAFWTQPALAQAEVSAQAHDQMTLTSRYFHLETTVRRDGVETVRRSLLQDRDGDVRVVAGRWTAD